MQGYHQHSVSFSHNTAISESIITEFYCHYWSFHTVDVYVFDSQMLGALSKKPVAQMICDA